mmetsp:Transcript_56428/g.111542  ORF Transcript_56428/g.111542 Transcript_56428/m.111542 type:complete len:343 (-) Transcript_56428:56-1084(-)
MLLKASPVGCSSVAAAKLPFLQPLRMADCPPSSSSPSASSCPPINVAARTTRVRLILGSEGASLEGRRLRLGLELPVLRLWVALFRGMPVPPAATLNRGGELARAEFCKKGGGWCCGEPGESGSSSRRLSPSEKETRDARPPSEPTKGVGSAGSGGGKKKTGGEVAGSLPLLAEEKRRRLSMVARRSALSTRLPTWALACACARARTASSSGCDSGSSARVSWRTQLLRLSATHRIALSLSSSKPLSKLLPGSVGFAESDSRTQRPVGKENNKGGLPSCSPPKLVPQRYPFTFGDPARVRTLLVVRSTSRKQWFPVSATRRRPRQQSSAKGRWKAASAPTPS